MGIDTAPGQALADALALVLSHHASCDGGPALRDGGCAFPGCDRPPSDCWILRLVRATVPLVGEPVFR